MNSSTENFLVRGLLLAAILLMAASAARAECILMDRDKYREIQQEILLDGGNPNRVMAQRMEFCMGKCSAPSSRENGICILVKDKKEKK